MADSKQLARLKRGVIVWNKWRAKNPDVDVDLSAAKLSNARLQDANLSKVHLQYADLSMADLRGAHLMDTWLIGAKLNGADLRKANLNNATLWEADLQRADLRGSILNYARLHGANLHAVDLSGATLLNTELEDANLSRANLSISHLEFCNLSRTNLRESNFFGANIISTDLHRADFRKANLRGAHMIEVTFGTIDLSETKGLDEVDHIGPCVIGTDTIQLSKGEIPSKFLRGCGLSDTDIEYAKLAYPGLSNEEINNILYRLYDLRADKLFQISPLFISYSWADSKFVDKLENYLNEKGIRFWRDVHNAKAGRLEKQIHQAIRLNPTVLVILSKRSIQSDWVEHEARTARALEKELGRDVLCPVALDDSWKSSRWPRRLMEQVMEYNILDFSDWKNDRKFSGMFRKLIDGLQLFYKG